MRTLFPLMLGHAGASDPISTREAILVFILIFSYRYLIPSLIFLARDDEYGAGIFFKCLAVAQIPVLLAGLFVLERWLSRRGWRRAHRFWLVLAAYVVLCSLTNYLGDKYYFHLIASHFD